MIRCPSLCIKSAACHSYIIATEQRSKCISDNSFWGLCLSQVKQKERGMAKRFQEGYEYGMRALPTRWYYGTSSPCPSSMCGYKLQVLYSSNGDTVPVAPRREPGNWRQECYRSINLRNYATVISRRSG